MKKIIILISLQNFFAFSVDLTLQLEGSSTVSFIKSKLDKSMKEKYALKYDSTRIVSNTHLAMISTNHFNHNDKLAVDLFPVDITNSVGLKKYTISEPEVIYVTDDSLFIHKVKNRKPFELLPNTYKIKRNSRTKKLKKIINLQLDQTDANFVFRRFLNLLTKDAFQAAGVNDTNILFDHKIDQDSVNCKTTKRSKLMTCSFQYIAKGSIDIH